MQSGKDEYLQTKRFWGLIALFAGYLIKCAIDVFFARKLGPAAFGDYALLMRIAGVVCFILLLGSTRSVTRFIPTYLNQGYFGLSPYHLKRYAQALWYWLLALVLFEALLVSTVMVGHQLGYFNWTVLHPSIYGLGVLPLVLMIQLLSRLSKHYLPAMHHAMLGLRVRVASCITGLVAVGCVWGMLGFYAALTVLCVIFMVVILMQLLILSKAVLNRENAQEGDVSVRAKPWLRLSFPLMISELVFLGIILVDMVILELVGQHEPDVGVFAAIATMTGLFFLIQRGVIAWTSPLISRFVSRRYYEQLQVYTRKANTVLLVLIGALTAVFLIYSPWLLSVFGHGFQVGVMPFRWVLLGVSFSIAFSLLIPLLQSTLEQDKAFIGHFVLFMGNIFISVLFIHWWGLMGAAYSFFLARVITVFWYFVRVKLHFPFKLWFFV